jgi:hypothetical protein
MQDTKTIFQQIMIYIHLTPLQRITIKLEFIGPAYLNKKNLSKDLCFKSKLQLHPTPTAEHVRMLYDGSHDDELFLL